MLLELAIGDAYGAGFEYADTQLIRQFNNLSHYVQHPRHTGIRPGMYTDDTQMSIAIAELIVESAEWTPPVIAQKFVDCFKRDEREGYSPRFYRFLLQVKDSSEFLESMQPDSEKSGASMRAAPIGVFPTIAEVLEKCRIQAAITHNTPTGIDASCVAALMSHYFIYNLGEKKHLSEFITAHVPGEYGWNTPYRGKVKSKGWMSVRAALTSVMRNNTLTALLKDCINYGGDVDTVATIALAAASNSREYEQDLPQHLRDTLENGAYGRDYLIALDQRLMTQVRRP